jgi:hypothetical protein
MAVAVTIAPVAIQQFFANNDEFNVGGSILTQVGGVNYPTYQDSAGIIALPNPIPLNSRGEISNMVGATCQLFLQQGVVYTFTMFDAGGNQLDVATYVTQPAPFVLTQNSIGAVLYPQTAAELAAGVTPVNIFIKPYIAQRYGIVSDAANTFGLSGTDNTATIASALTIPQPIYFPAGNYGFKNLIVPGGSSIIGDGLNQTNFIALSGATGTMVTDNGSSAKTIIRGVSFFANGPSGGNCTTYTAGFTIGKTIAFGTEGYIDQLQVRDLPSNIGAGFPGIDITGNVAEIGAIYALNTGGVQIAGAGNLIQYIESVGSQGWLLGSGQVTCLNLQDCTAAGIEIEAPGDYITGGSLISGGTGTPNFSGSTVVPLVLGGGSGSPGGNVSIGTLFLSLAANTVSPAITHTYDHLIELSSGASTWKIDNIKLYYGGAGGSQAAFTGGLFKDSTGFFGGTSPTTTGTHAPENNYSSGLFTTGSLAVKRQALQSFKVRVVLTGATLQHQIGNAGDATVAGNFVGQITGAINTLTNTPTGTDASTAFAAGAKIGSASPSILYFNTVNPITAADSVFLCSIVANNSGTAYNVAAFISSININGVTQARLAIQLTNPTSGAGVNWATALGSAGNLIDVGFLGFLR